MLKSHTTVRDSRTNHTLKEFVENILELLNEARWGDEILKQLFWRGIDDILGQMLLLREDHHPFI